MLWDSVPLSRFCRNRVLGLSLLAGLFKTRETRIDNLEKTLGYYLLADLKAPTPMAEYFRLASFASLASRSATSSSVMRSSAGIVGELDHSRQWSMSVAVQEGLRLGDVRKVA